MIIVEDALILPHPISINRELSEGLIETAMALSLGTSSSGWRQFFFSNVQKHIISHKSKLNFKKWFNALIEHLKFGRHGCQKNFHHLRSGKILRRNGSKVPEEFIDFVFRMVMVVSRLRNSEVWQTRKRKTWPSEKEIYKSVSKEARITLHFRSKPVSWQSKHFTFLFTWHHV